jgi:hypothetical protein
MSSAGGVPDPALHTSYIWDPGDVFLRYSPALFDPALARRLGPAAAYLREGARVGFLVPARLTYLAFGALAGFFAFRYVLALVAVVPAYLLLKRLYGAGAGALAVVAIMSAPVIVTAWGTDFPDAAEISYLLGGLACLVMPAATRGARVAWVAGSAVLLTMSVWALASSAVVIAVSMAVWLVTRLLRERRWLVPDLTVIAVVAVVVTAVLGLGSWALLGPVDFVTTTVRSLEFLDSAGQVALWHSTSWRWAPHDSYLLVLPAVALAWSATFYRRSRPMSPAVLVLGAGFCAQVVVAAYAQFFNHVEILENHFFSSALWAASTLTLVLVVAELTRSFAPYRALQFVPAGLAALVALGYEAAPALPHFGWAPIGLCLAVVVIGAAGFGSWVGRASPPVLDHSGAGGASAGGASAGGASAGGASAALVVMSAILAMTVAPSPWLTITPGTTVDPPTGYAGALGGSSARFVASYRLAAEVRHLVPNAKYPGEQLLTCWSAETNLTLQVISVFHAGPNLVPGRCPAIAGPAIQLIRSRRAAQLLVVSNTGLDAQILMARLRQLDPVLARHAVLRSGRYTCWVWLIEFPRYLSQGPSAGGK